MVEMKRSLNTTRCPECGNLHKTEEVYVQRNSKLVKMSNLNLSYCLEHDKYIVINDAYGRSDLNAVNT